MSAQCWLLPQALLLSLTGTKYGGGGVVTQNLVLTSALTNYAISGFDNIVDLQISFDGSTDFAPYDLDNIQLDVVPIPAAIWLFVSALGVTGLWRKRRPSY